MRRRDRHRQTAGQGGFVLAIALVAMAIVGLVIAALLVLATANTVSTNIIRDQAARARVADSALEQAIVRIGKNYTAATTSGATPTEQAAARELGKLSSPCEQVDPVTSASG